MFPSPRFRCVAVLLTIALLPAAETWDPQQHPAALSRVVTSFTRPRYLMDLAAEYQARIESLSVDDGDAIPADTAVVQLDATMARLQRDSATAALASSRLALQQVQAGIDLAAREQAYRLSERRRIQGLARQGRAPEQELDQAVFQEDRAGLLLTEVQARLAAAQVAVTQAEVALTQAEEVLRRHVLHAPAGWTVVQRLQQPGSLVSPGQPILQLADTRILVVPVALSDRELRALRQQAPVLLSFPQHHAPAAAARVARVAVTFDERSRKRQVELELVGADAPEASGGLEVQLTIEVPDPAGGLRIPRAAVAVVGEQLFVECDDQQRRAVTVIRNEAEFVVVSPDSIPAGVSVLLPDGTQ
jgi:biotin carboxyl carrier protein